MKTILRLSEVDDAVRQTVGGKAVALARVARTSLAVPKTVCVGAQVYDRFVETTGLRARILLEYERKPFDEMRWEEIWDTALRIQNLFLNTEMPHEIATPLREAIGREFANDPVVVRSSAMGEDSIKASFAGLHESFVNVRGIASILEHIKLVWASLWSDRAMLYRAEIGLNVSTSRMAVVVQELVQGQKSGVMFGVSPTDESKAVIEAVYGLNQGLVDGTIEPDRWMIDRARGTTTSHIPASREKMVATKSKGVAVVPLPRRMRSQAPLGETEVREVFQAEKALENVFGATQDVEWTYRNARLHILQSRPITTAAHLSQQDLRPWYISLHRSLENLQGLRQSIENEDIPRMVRQAERLAEVDLARLPDENLAREIRARDGIYKHWQQCYWDYFIPFAHAIRLFGQFYNRVLKPKDPHEFAELLPSKALRSVERNQRLIRAAQKVSKKSKSQRGTKARQSARSEERSDVSRALTGGEDSSTLSVLLKTAPADRQKAFFDELAKIEGARTVRDRASRSIRVKRFLEAVPAGERKQAAELLDLARASYKLRDDDNIYLGRIEAELLRALSESASRSRKAAKVEIETANAELFARALIDPGFQPPRRKRSVRDQHNPSIRARQLVGQSAGHGVAVGPARVVTQPEDLLDFRKGEILVCDAVDPNMTFVVPLAAGIVERRGGMLIHGAIIAREYGLPCVTGVADVCNAVKTGDSVTVDGYLGIITLGSARAQPLEPARPHRRSGRAAQPKF